MKYESALNKLDKRITEEIDRYIKGDAYRDGLVGHIKSAINGLIARKVNSLISNNEEIAAIVDKTAKEVLDKVVKQKWKREDIRHFIDTTTHYYEESIQECLDGLTADRAGEDADRIFRLAMKKCGLKFKEEEEE